MSFIDDVIRRSRNVEEREEDKNKINVDRLNYVKSDMNELKEYDVIEIDAQGRGTESGRHIMGYGVIDHIDDNGVMLKVYLDGDTAEGYVFLNSYFETNSNYKSYFSIKYHFVDDFYFNLIKKLVGVVNNHNLYETADGEEEFEIGVFWDGEFKLKDMNESFIDDVIRRSMNVEERDEDKLNKDETDYVQRLMGEFADGNTRINDWETQYTLDNFLDYAKLNAEDDGYNWEKIKKYIQDNWTVGRQICDYVNPQNEDDEVEESFIDDVIRRSRTGEERNEDELEELDMKVLNLYITSFANDRGLYGYLGKESNKYEGNRKEQFLRYVRNFRHRYMFMKEYEGYNINNILEYIENHWDKGTNIEQMILKASNTNESFIDDVIRRSRTGEDREEDKWTEKNQNTLDLIIRDLKNQPIRSYFDFLAEVKWLEERGYTYSESDKIKDYVKKHWSEIYGRLNESFIDDVIRRSRSGEVRTEDKLDPINLKVLKKYIEHFLDPDGFDGFYGEYSHHWKGHRKDQFLHYIRKYGNIFQYMYEYEGYSIKTIINYVEVNWNIVEQMISKKTMGVKESFIDDVIRRSRNNEERQEDKLSENDKKVLDNYIGMFCSNICFEGDYDNTLDDFIAFIKDNANNIKIEKLNPDVDKIIEYVKDHWVDEICDEIDDEIDTIERTNESFIDDVIRRSRNNEERQEDKLDEHDKVVLYNIINMFRSACKYGETYSISLSEFERYLDSLESGGFKSWNKEKMVRYIRNNWDKGDNLENKIKNVNECDAVAPNGGLTFGDVSGMGPILFPGECGEKGSGDLPMPSGKVYQQVAPFSKFIKTKKKKKKKFDKKDEPCAKYTNPPVYSHVDDFRDYVNRTYDIVDRK